MKSQETRNKKNRTTDNKLGVTEKWPYRLFLFSIPLPPRRFRFIFVTRQPELVITFWVSFVHLFTSQPNYYYILAGPGLYPPSFARKLIRETHEELAIFQKRIYIWRGSEDKSDYNDSSATRLFHSGVRSHHGCVLCFYWQGLGTFYQTTFRKIGCRHRCCCFFGVLLRQL